MPRPSSHGLLAFLHRPLGIALVITGLIAGSGIAVGAASLLAMRASTTAQVADTSARLAEDATRRFRDSLDAADVVLDALRAHALEPLPSPEEDARFLIALARGRGAVSQANLGRVDGRLRGVWLDDQGDWHYLRLGPADELPRSVLGLRLRNDLPTTSDALRPEDAAYDPRAQPWFLAALGARTRTWTSPYLFSRSRLAGVSCVEPLADGWVADVDFDFRSLGQILDRLDGADAATVLFTAEREILAVPARGRPAVLDRVLRAEDLDSPIAQDFFRALTRLPAPGDPPLLVGLQGPAGPPLQCTVAACQVPDGPVWYVGRLMSRDQLAAAGSRARAWAIVAGCAALLPGLLAALWYARVLTRARAEAVRERDRAEAAEARARRLGQYHLIRRLGSGGMGEVFLARHAMLRRPAAVKVMRLGTKAEDMARFEREVQLSCRLTHPNTVTIYDYGRAADGAFFYAMEYLEGLDLDTLVELHGTMPPGRVVHILAQACGSLAEAHALNLVHRDIKPANIMLCNRGGTYDVVKVLDFGLVKSLVEERKAITSSEVITGTPEFMAPEVIAQDPGADGRLDVYALACVGYFLLTGRLVFERSTTMETMLAHRDEPAPPPSRLGPDIPPDLEAVLMKALAKHPRDRQQGMAALRDELLACTRTPAWTQADARAWWEAHPLPTGDTGSHAAIQDGMLLDAGDRPR